MATTLAQKLQPEPVDKIACFEIDQDWSFGFQLVTASAGAIVWPLHHLALARTSAAGTELLIVWWTHNLTLAGRNLDAIAMALRRGQSVIVREVPRRFDELYTSNDVFVGEAIIAERKEDGEAAE